MRHSSDPERSVARHIGVARDLHAGGSAERSARATDSLSYGLSQNGAGQSETTGRTGRIPVRVLGYTSAPGGAGKAREELERQGELIAQDCEGRGLELIEVVHEREPVNGKAMSRPGLAYALRRIADGEASGLIVAELGRLTHSAAELGKLIEWLRNAAARFVVVAHGLDTGQPEGRLATDLLVEVSRWESVRLSERTRSGLQAARRTRGSSGRPAVIDNAQLGERIVQMRAQGMTLQAIADQFNDEGVPTVRGGAKWRHSSIQAAAGYRRPPRAVAGGVAPT